MVYVTFIIKKNAVKMMEVSMKKLDRKSITMSMLGLVAIVGVGQQVLAQDIEKTSQEVQAPILVTEVVPNTDNLNSLDAYEYFELTNITDQSVDMENYDLVYLMVRKQVFGLLILKVFPQSPVRLFGLEMKGIPKLQNLISVHIIPKKDMEK